MTDTQTTAASAAASPNTGNPARRNPARDIALIAVFAAFIAVCSIISIPIGAAPITLQTFAVLLTGAVLGASRGFLAALLYLAVGAIGIPVFAGGGAGVASFMSGTAGYLVSFPLAAWLVGLIVSRVATRISHRSIAARTVLVFVAALIANIVFVYPLGIAGLMIFADMSFTAAFTLNLGFIPLDLVKMALAAIVAVPVHRAFPALLPARGTTARQAA